MSVSRAYTKSYCFVLLSSNVKVHNVTIKTSLDAPFTDGIVPGMIASSPGHCFKSEINCRISVSMAEPISPFSLQPLIPF